MNKMDFTKFDSQDYLNEFYSDRPENDLGEDFALHWFQMIYDELKPKGNYLEFGGGPTIYSLITISKYITEIHFSDYLENNIDEVKKWKEDKGHNWDLYIRRALQFEGHSYSAEDITDRKNTIKEKLKKFLVLDQRQENTSDELYNIVAANFVPDSSTSSPEELRLYTRNILTYLQEGGLFVMSVLKKSRDYTVGNKVFSSVYLDENDFQTLLEDSGIHILKMSSITTNDKNRHVGGYMFSVGTKRSR